VPSARGANHLRRRQRVRRILRAQRVKWKGGVLDDQVVRRQVEIVVASEAEIVVLLLARRVA
jgi:hypothetical protein